MVFMSHYLLFSNLKLNHMNQPAYSTLIHTGAEDTTLTIEKISICIKYLLGQTYKCKPVNCQSLIHSNLLRFLPQYTPPLVDFIQ